MAYNKPYVSNNNLVLVPEVTISNKFTIVDTLHIEQDVNMIVNQYSKYTFLSYDIQFPRDGQLQSDSNPLLVFKQVFTLNSLGSKYSFNPVSTPYDISSAINSLEDTSEANDKYLENKFNG